MSTDELYRVVAKRWRDGWELHVGGVGVTQTRTLDGAFDQVVDYLETVFDTDFDETPMIELRVDLDEFEAEVKGARIAVEEAERARTEAALRLRRVATALRHDVRLSVSDSAYLLDVSRGRVSQLVD